MFASTIIFVETDATPEVCLSIGFDFYASERNEETELEKPCEVEVFENADLTASEELTWEQFQAKYPTLSHEATLQLQDAIWNDRALQVELYAEAADWGVDDGF